MRKATMIILSLLLAFTIAATLPAQVFADSLPEYISEVKIGMGKKASDAKAALDGYKILSDSKGNPVDLNKDAGGGLGSKGDKVVYLGYKTTTDRKEAVTDLALMNMKGGYSVEDYEALMEGQMKSQIIPFVEDFLAAIEEYRINCRSGNSSAYQRANYIRGILNKFIDDDTGKGLGDLLLKKTVYELGMDAYNKLSAADKAKTDVYTESRKVYDSLSDSEKKEHADILTILAQSNGKATLMMENLITRAADPWSNTWVERLSEMDSYENFVDLFAEDMELLPSDAKAELKKNYDNDANTVLNMYSDFRENLLKYDEYKKLVDNYDFDAADEKLDSAAEINDESDESEFEKAVEDYAEVQNDIGEIMLAVSYMVIHDNFADMAYGDGTLLDFFTQEPEEIENNISVLYPVVASFSDGQRAGLEFVTLRELSMIAFSDPENYSDDSLDSLGELSIYDGVDRGIYQKGGVALTSDALRKKAQSRAVEENTVLSGWTIASMVITGICLVGAVASAIARPYYKAAAPRIREIIRTSGNNSISMYKSKYFSVTTKFGNKSKWLDDIYAVRVGQTKWLAIGFTVAMVVFAAVTTGLAYRDMVNYYKVDFTPIPHYMVEEKDIVSYNEYGDKTVIKNQTAYYEAVECNRKSGDEFYKTLGTCADMNGDVGKQWLALYVQKSDVFPPILADSLIAVKGKSDIPAGYKTGIHMFGSGAAFNLNSGLYDWNKDAPGIYVYFKVDSSAAKSASAGSSFTAGNLAISGVAGLGIGAVACALVSKAAGRKKKADAA